jgi:hypothetical protein
MNKKSIIHQQLSAHRHPCSRVSQVSAMRPDHALRDRGSIILAYLPFVFLILKCC